jgi:hypothetical protein
MRRSLTAALVAGLGILTLSGAAVASDGPAPDSGATTSSDGSSRQGRTLEFDVQFTGFFGLDFSATGVREVTDPQQIAPSRGDQLVFEDHLFRRGEQVGEGGGTCTITEATEGAFLACQATYDLPGGQLTAQGRTTPAPEKTLAVTGGTGKYVGASGELVVTEFGDGTGSLVVRLARR